MNTSPEHFYISEIPGIGSPGDTGHTSASVLEELKDKRERMLREIERDITADFRSAIQNKIAYELRTLRTLLERERNTQVHKSERHGVLKSEYFIRRPLPPSQF